MKELTLEQKISLNAKMDFALQINCINALKRVEEYLRDYHKQGYEVEDEIKMIRIYEQIIQNYKPICKYNCK